VTAIYLHVSLECPGPNEWQFLKLFPCGGSANACCGVTTLGTTATTNPTATTIAITAIIVFRLFMATLTEDLFIMMLLEISNGFLLNLDISY
jgi:hypothetical protein